MFGIENPKSEVVNIVEKGMSAVVDNVLSSIALFYRKVGKTKLTGEQVADLIEAIRKETNNK